MQTLRGGFLKFAGCKFEKGAVAAMAMYSFGRIKIISRNGTKSAVATAAYHAATKLTNEYDGLTHDHRRKKNVEATYIRMPESVPAAWRDESIPVDERLNLIWNTVEKNNPAQNARLARSNYLAIQHNLTMEQNLECVDRFIKENCTDRGMGAIYSVHLKPNNWHVDVMYLASEYDAKGKPKAKSKKEYLCRNRDGGEAFFDSEGIKKAKGYEKVYKYQNADGERKDMTPSEASEQDGWERINKYPVCRTVKVSGWDDPDLAKKWRKSWEVILNEKFEELGMPDRVDCRSNKERGISRVATIHEGWGPGSEERKEYNQQVREFNKKVDELHREGVAAVYDIYDQINDLKNNEQTEETLAAHEVRYQTNEGILSAFVESDLFSVYEVNLFKVFIDDLKKKMSVLIDKVLEQIKSRQNENMGLSEAFEKTSEATRNVKESLNSMISGAAKRNSSSGKNVKEKDNVL